jgi:cytochrome c oxidase subunit 3
MVGLKFSFILFLLRELIFFFSIFWFYFSVSLVPRVELGEIWGPFGLVLINPFGLPFFNTILLLSRAVFLTWAHNQLLENGSVFNSLFISIFLGFVFLSIQFQEYNISFFALNDRVFGTIFYFGTGFHGLHVVIGCLGLRLSLWFLKEKKINIKFHNGFEISIIY